MRKKRLASGEVHEYSKKDSHTRRQSIRQKQNVFFTYTDLNGAL